MLNAIIVTIVIVVSSLIWKILQNMVGLTDYQMYTEIKELMSILIIPIVGFLVVERIRHDNDLKKQVSSKKYDTYMSVMKDLYDGVKAVKNPENDETLKLSNMFINRPDMIIFASDEVLKQYNNMHLQLSSARGLSREEALVYIADLALLIRKDMGNSKTKISREEVLRPIFDEILMICNISPEYERRFKDLLKT